MKRCQGTGRQWILFVAAWLLSLAAVAGPIDELLAGPRGDTGRIERLADDEQGGDEHHDRIAEPAERLLDVQDPGRQQDEGRPDGHELDRQSGALDLSALTRWVQARLGAVA